MVFYMTLINSCSFLSFLPRNMSNDKLSLVDDIVWFLDEHSSVCD